MEITNEDVISLFKCIQDIPKTNEHLPTKFYYILSKNRRKLLGVFEDIEETRMHLVKKYGKKDPKSGFSTVPTENMEPFTKEYSKILNETVDIDFHKIDYEFMEREMKTMKGVSNIFLLFDYLVSDNGINKEKSVDKPIPKDKNPN